MIDLSVVELARGLREPIFSVRQQIEERGSVGGIETHPVRDETGRIEKVQVSEQVATRLDLTVPKAKDRPNPEPEANREPEPETTEVQELPELPESRPVVATESVESLETVQSVPAKSQESRRNPGQTGNPIGWIAFGALAATAFMSESVRNEMVRYFRDYPRL